MEETRVEINIYGRQLKKQRTEENDLKFATDGLDADQDNRELDCLGYFGHLPREMFFYLLEYLNVSEVGVFAITSRRLGQHVLSWLFSIFIKTKLAHVIEYLANGRTNCDVGVIRELKGIGILLKRTTMLLPTARRTMILVEFTDHLESLACYGVAGCTSSLHVRGIIIQQFTLGWEDFERVKVFNVLDQRYHFRHKLRGFLHEVELGCFPVDSNCSLRSGLRYIFIDWCPFTSTRAFWFHLILKGYSMKNKAVILMLLYTPEGPNHKLKWTWATNANVLVHRKSYAAIATAISQLRFNTKSWGLSKRAQLVRALIESPTAWPTRSVAALFAMLFQTDPLVVKKIFLSLIQDSAVGQVACIITDLLCVSRSFQLHQSPGFLEAFHDILRVLSNAVKCTAGAHDFWTILERNIRERFPLVPDNAEADLIIHRLNAIWLAWRDFTLHYLSQ